MTTAIYTRISETDDDRGVTRQYEDCAQLAQRLGLADVVLYEDNDTSATKARIVRKRYRAMLADIKSGAVTHVIAWHTTRLYRRLEELPELIDLVNAHDVKISTCKSGEIDLTTATGRMLARINGAVAMHEIEQNGERATREKRQRAESGKWNGGRRPTGYDLAHDADGDLCLVINEREAAAIRKAVDAVLAGTSQVIAARDFGDALGKRVRQSTLRQIIAKPMLAGLAVYRGEVIGKGDWPAIITEEQHRLLQAIVDKRSMGPRVTPGRVHIGSGIYRCSICREGVVTTGAARGKMRYSCPEKCCARIGSYVDEYVLRTVRVILASPTIINAYRQTCAVDLSALIAERDALKMRKRNLVAAYNAGVIELDDMTEGSIAARDRIAELDSQIAAGSLDDAASILLSDDPVAAFDEGTLDNRRAAIAALINVTLLPAGKGRPSGWKVGEPYFNESSVQITSALPGVDFDSLTVE